MSAESAATLFVRNLPYATTKEELKEAFAKFEATSARIITERRFGRIMSRGIGFVDFATQEARDKVLGTEFTVGGRKLFINKARAPRKRDTAFIKGMPAGTKKEDLLKVFEKFNPKDAKVVKEDAEGFTGFGFVLFTPEDLTAALQENKTFTLNGKEVSAMIARRAFAPRRRPVRKNRRAPKKAEPAAEAKP